MADEPRTRAARGGAPDPPRRVVALPLLLDENEARAGEAPQLRLGGVAGSGRMAVVHEAIQLPLQRLSLIHI